MTVPVTVIGGYLGAGKTTLVNRLLRQADGRRLAVLVNEFGALPIDADLIESRDENVINIEGGCVCCSYGSDLIAALRDLQTIDPKPDHILIEASGVALPDAIAQSVTLIADYAVDGIVVLADAETLRERGEDRYLADTIRRQLAAADILLLNKTDLVSEDELALTHQWLEDRETSARVVKTSNADIAPPTILGPGAAENFQRLAGEAEPHAHHHTALLSVDGPVDPAGVGDILADPRFDLIRAKGFVLGDDDTVYAVQTVGGRKEIAAFAGAPREIGQIVCIRQGGPVDIDGLEAALARVSISPAR